MTTRPLPALPGIPPVPPGNPTTHDPAPDDSTAADLDALAAEVVGVRRASAVPDVHTVGLAPAMLPRATGASPEDRYISAGFTVPVVAVPTPAPAPAPTEDAALDPPPPSAEALDALLPPPAKRRRVGTLDPASGYKRAPWTAQQDLDVRLRAVTSESVEDFLEAFPTRSPEALAHRLSLGAREVESFHDDGRSKEPMPEYVARRSLWMHDCLEAADNVRVAEYHMGDVCRDTIRALRDMAAAVRSYATTGADEYENDAATPQCVNMRAAFLLAMPRPGYSVWPPEGVWFDPDRIHGRGPDGMAFLGRVVNAICDRSTVSVIAVYGPTGAKVGNVVQHDGHGIHVAFTGPAATPAPDPDLRGTPVLDAEGTVIGFVTGRDDTGLRVEAPAGTKATPRVDPMTAFLARDATHKALDTYKAIAKVHDAAESLRLAILGPGPSEPGAVIAVVGALGQTGRMDPTEALQIVVAEVAKLRGLAAGVMAAPAITAAESSLCMAGTLAVALDASPGAPRAAGVLTIGEVLEFIDPLDADDTTAPRNPIG